MTICGAGLLYAKHYPERLYQLRNANIVGPTSHDDPPLRERRCRLAAENNLIEFDDFEEQRAELFEKLAALPMD